MMNYHEKREHERRCAALTAWKLSGIEAERRKVRRRRELADMQADFWARYDAARRVILEKASHTRA